MKRTLDIELNYDSIMDAVRYLEQYRTWIEVKTEQLVRALMERGYRVVMANQNLDMPILKSVLSALRQEPRSIWKGKTFFSLNSAQAFITTAR